MNIIITSVKSSLIDAIGYHAPTQTLSVQFKPRKGKAEGPTYHYANVTPEIYAAMTAEGESIGGYFIRTIKAHPELFPFEQQPETEEA